MRTRECQLCNERTPDSEMDRTGVCLSCAEEWGSLDEDEKFDKFQNFLLLGPSKREGLTIAVFVALLLLVVICCP